MSRIYYRQHQSPGCGGCLLILMMIVLLTGGNIFDFFGVVFFMGLSFIVLLLTVFWAFNFFIRSRIASYEKSQTETHNIFVHLLVNILVKIAQVDGRVTRDEVRAIRHFFQYNLRYSQSQLFWVKELIKEALKATVSLDFLLKEFRGQFA